MREEAPLGREGVSYPSNSHTNMWTEESKNHQIQPNVQHLTKWNDSAHCRSNCTEDKNLHLLNFCSKASPVLSMSTKTVNIAEGKQRCANLCEWMSFWRETCIEIFRKKRQKMAVTTKLLVHKIGTDIVAAKLAPSVRAFLKHKSVSCPVTYISPVSPI